MGLEVHGVNLEDLDSHSTVTLWPRIASGMRSVSGVLDIVPTDRKEARSAWKSGKGKSSSQVAERNSRYVYSPVTPFSNIILELIWRNLVVVFLESIVNDSLLCFCFLPCPQLAVGKFSRIEGQSVYETWDSRIVHTGAELGVFARSLATFTSGNPDLNLFGRVGWYSKEQLIRELPRHRH